MMNGYSANKRAEDSEIKKKGEEEEINCLEYAYGEEDFDLSHYGWPTDGISFVKSKFDEVLSENWDTALANGSFWYTLDDVKRRHLDGKIGFIAQLNTKRFSTRRKPIEIHTVKQPFSNEKFNFTKVRKKEVLFNLKTKEHQGVKENLLIINVSPIEYCHVLFVPDCSSLLSQALNYDALRMAVEICLLSTHRGLRIGFNSLCAFASVNHLHFHLMYINHLLPIDKVQVNPLTHGLFELMNYPVRGFALQLENGNIHELARRTQEIASYFHENEIAHNLLICRHAPLNTNADINSSTIVVFIFPKLPAPGEKDTKYLNSCCFDLAGYLLLKVDSEYPFNSAALEVAGFFPMRDEREYEELTEIDSITVLNRFCLLEDEFSELKNRLTFLLQNLHL